MLLQHSNISVKNSINRCGGGMWNAHIPRNVYLSTPETGRRKQTLKEQSINTGETSPRYLVLLPSTQGGLHQNTTPQFFGLCL